MIKPPPAEHIYLGYVVGYRRWRCQGGQLFPYAWGPSRRLPCWPPKEAAVANGVVALDTGAGFDAYKTLAQCQVPGEDLPPALRWRCGEAFGDVVGAVALWGKVVEHEKGYRAEYAYPLWLVAP